jgi:hypothetical protein
VTRRTRNFVLLALVLIALVVGVIVLLAWSLGPSGGGVESSPSIL